MEIANETDFNTDTLDSLTIQDSQMPIPGTPFSAIIKSMWPEDILTKLEKEAKSLDPNEQPDYRYCL